MKPPNVPCIKCGGIHWSREPCISAQRKVPISTQVLNAVKDPQARKKLAALPTPKVIVRRSPRGR